MPQTSMTHLLAKSLLYQEDKIDEFLCYADAYPSLDRMLLRKFALRVIGMTT